MLKPFENKPDAFFGKFMTRRDCLRYLMRGWGLLLALPLSMAKAVENPTGLSILDKYLGEELSYQIGFWFIGHCGDAKTGFLRTDVPDIYRISLEGHGVGFINFLLGRVKYSYLSFCQYLPDEDRLRPLYFELKKKRGDKQNRRSVTFNYAVSNQQRRCVFGHR